MSNRRKITASPVMPRMPTVIEAIIEIEGRPAREWAFIPALLLLLTVGALQRRLTVAGPF